MIRTIVVAIAAATLLTMAGAPLAATYKCKDADGNWTEQACPAGTQKPSSPASSARPSATRPLDPPFNPHQSPAVGMTESNIYSLDPPWNRPYQTRDRKDHGVYVDEFWYRENGEIATRLVFRNGILTEILKGPRPELPEPPFDPHGGPVIGLRLSKLYELGAPWNHPDKTFLHYDDEAGVRIDEYSYNANGGSRLVFRDGVLYEIH